MPYRVEITSEANQDVADAYEFYEQKQPGLGEAFLVAFERRCKDLTRHPANYGLIPEDPKRV